MPGGDKGGLLNNLLNLGSLLSPKEEFNTFVDSLKGDLTRHAESISRYPTFDDRAGGVGAFRQTEAYDPSETLFREPTQPTELTPPNALLGLMTAATLPGFIKKGGAKGVAKGGQALAKLKREGEEAAAAIVAKNKPAPTPVTIGWHGTGDRPAFKTFKLEKMSTGTGGQMQGHGIYQAEAKGTGVSYRKAVGGGPSIHVGGEEVLGDFFVKNIPLPSKFLKNTKGKTIHVMDILGELEDLVTGGVMGHRPISLKKAIADVRKDLTQSGKTQQMLIDAGMDKVSVRRNNSFGSYSLPPPREELAIVKKKLAILDEMEEAGMSLVDRGLLYESKILAPKESFLEWDLPLMKQSPQVREAITKLIESQLQPGKRQIIERIHGWPGNALYDYIKKGHLGSNEAKAAAASKELRSIGIRGIRYKDQLSRKGKRDTSNMVLFDPKDIEPISINGIPIADYEKVTGKKLLTALAGLGVAGAAAPAREDETQ